VRQHGGPAIPVHVLVGVATQCVPASFLFLLHAHLALWSSLLSTQHSTRQACAYCVQSSRES
jgi:hypothetical protein